MAQNGSCVAPLPSDPSDPSLAHAHTRALTHALAHGRTRALAHALAHGRTRALAHAPAHALVHARTFTLARALSPPALSPPLSLTGWTVSRCACTTAGAAPGDDLTRERTSMTAGGLRPITTRVHAHTLTHTRTCTRTHTHTHAHSHARAHPPLRARSTGHGAEVVLEPSGSPSG
jgi:hypothetical protein